MDTMTDTPPNLNVDPPIKLSDLIAQILDEDKK